MNSPNLSKSMLLSSIASIIFQITYKTQNLVKCQGTLRIKTQSIRKVDRKIYQTKHLSAPKNENRSPPKSTKASKGRVKQASKTGKGKTSRHKHTKGDGNPKPPGCVWAKIMP